MIIIDDRIVIEFVTHHFRRYKIQRGRQQIDWRRPRIPLILRQGMSFSSQNLLHYKLIFL